MKVGDIVRHIKTNRVGTVNSISVQGTMTVSTDMGILVGKKREFKFLWAGKASTLNNTLQDLIKALEAGHYNAAPSKLKQGSSLDYSLLWS